MLKFDSRNEPGRLQIAHLPTPVHFLPRLSKELDKELFVWRDDMTEATASGNKIRKLEYLLADALAQKATDILTCGGIQSNHVRATALLAPRIGLQAHAIVRLPKDQKAPNPAPLANDLLYQLSGLNVCYVDYATYQQRGASYSEFLKEQADVLSRQGRKVYVIPEGGSCPVGAWGYIRGAAEFLKAWTDLGHKAADLGGLFFALGSGGTFAGLVLGFDRIGLDPGRLFAVNVCDDRDYFLKRVGRLLTDTVKTYDMPAKEFALQIVDGYVGRGYSLATDDELRFYADVARADGLILDPCYSGKAFRGMVTEVKKNPQHFPGKICFLHTGGVWALPAYASQFAQALNPAFRREVLY